jgi:hypothetical protein
MKKLTDMKTFKLKVFYNNGYAIRESTAKNILEAFTKIYKYESKLFMVITGFELICENSSNK